MADNPAKAEHDARVKALNEANAKSAMTQGMPPTPTQEENDLLALGLMHVDEKSSGATDKRAPHPAERAPEPARRSS